MGAGPRDAIPRSETMENPPNTACLRGLVTDQDLELAEQEFPGICDFYATRRGRDRTFLELLHAYLERDCLVQHAA